MSSSLQASARRHAIAALARTAGFYALLIVSLFVGSDIRTVRSWLTIAVVAVVLATVVTVRLPLERIADRLMTRIRPASPTTQFHNIVSEIAIALNEPAESVQSHDSKVANVAMLPTSTGAIVVATTGALETLTRYELQALVAAQFAGMRDRWCRLATKAEILWWFIPFAAPVVLLYGIATSRIVAAFWFFGCVCTLVLPRWNEQARDLCADVAAVRITFDPHSLAGAMRKLSENADHAHHIDLGEWYLPTSPFLVLPKRVKSATSVGSGTDKQRSWNSTDEVRVELTLRADRAEAMAAGAKPYLLTGKEFRRRWSQLGR